LIFGTEIVFGLLFFPIGKSIILTSIVIYSIYIAWNESYKQVCDFGLH